MIALIDGLGILFALAAVILVFGFWLWAVVDCATHEPSTGNDKLVWILIILFAHIFGALVYSLYRRPRRRALLGA